MDDSGEEVSPSEEHATILFSGDGSITAKSKTAHTITIAKTSGEEEADDRARLRSESPVPDSSVKLVSDQSTPVIDTNTGDVYQRLAREKHQHAELVKRMRALVDDNAQHFRKIHDIGEQLEKAKEGKKVKEGEAKSSLRQVRILEEQCANISVDNRRLKQRNEDLTGELMKKQSLLKAHAKEVGSLRNRVSEMSKGGTMTANQLGVSGDLEIQHAKALLRIEALQHLLEHAEFLGYTWEGQFVKREKDIRRYEDRIEKQSSQDPIDANDLWTSMEVEQVHSKTLSDEFVDAGENPEWFSREQSLTAERGKSEGTFEEREEDKDEVENHRSPLGANAANGIGSEYDGRRERTSALEPGTAEEGKDRQKYNTPPRSRSGSIKSSPPAESLGSRDSRVSSDGSYVKVPNGPGSPFGSDWSEIGGGTSSEGSWTKSPVSKTTQSETKGRDGERESEANVTSKATKKPSDTKNLATSKSPGQSPRKATSNAVSGRRDSIPSTDGDPSDGAMTNSTITASTLTEYSNDERGVWIPDLDCDNGGADQQPFVRLPTIEESEVASFQTFSVDYGKTMPSQDVDRGDLDWSEDSVVEDSEEAVLSPRTVESVKSVPNPGTDFTFNRNGSISQHVKRNNDLAASIAELLKTRQGTTSVAGSEYNPTRSMSPSVEHVVDPTADLVAAISGLLEMYEPRHLLIESAKQFTSPESEQTDEQGWVLQSLHSIDGLTSSSQSNRPPTRESVTGTAQSSYRPSESGSSSSGSQGPKTQSTVSRGDSISSEHHQPPEMISRKVSINPRAVEAMIEFLRTSLASSWIWLYFLWLICVFYLYVPIYRERQLWRGSNNSMAKTSTLEWRDESWGSKTMANMEFATERWLQIDRSSLG